MVANLDASPAVVLILVVIGIGATLNHSRPTVVLRSGPGRPCSVAVASQLLTDDRPEHTAAAFNFAVDNVVLCS